MKLDVIIPHFKEPLELVSKAIISIRDQIDYDFKDTTVYIANDYGHVPLDFSSFDLPFKLVQLYMPEKKTLGELRQFALDNTNGDYILWCDSDDHFLDNTYFSYLDSEVRDNPQLQMILTPFFREAAIADDHKVGAYKYVRVNGYLQIMTLHGKLYKRSFLEKFDIRFPALDKGEDTYFNYSLMPYCRYTVYSGSEHASYLYCFNPESVTKKDDPFLNDGFKGLLSRTISFPGEDLFLERIITDPRSIIKNSDEVPTLYLLGRYYNYVAYKRYTDSFIEPQRRQVELMIGIKEGNYLDKFPEYRGFPFTEIPTDEEIESVRERNRKNLELYNLAVKKFDDHFRKWKDHIIPSLVKENEDIIAERFHLPNSDFLGYINSL